MMLAVESSCMRDTGVGCRYMLPVRATAAAGQRAFDARARGSPLIEQQQRSGTLLR